MDRLAEDSQHRTYELPLDAEETVFNSTELRCIDLELETDAGPVQVVRRSYRLQSGSRGVARNPKKFTLPTESECVILNSCW